ncbi:MAG: GFA family protein [Deltaproteobacteria bacterium]|nr:GFA family protein [Deltaproteobacteria bacterium]
MIFEGGCYCGNLRYRSEGEVLGRGQCHCRECQYSSGGSPNMIMAMPREGFTYTRGKPTGHTRDDLDVAVTREFCAKCGTHVLIRVPPMPSMVMLRVGTLDEPDLFGMPDMAIFLCDKRIFHVVPEGVPTFDKEDDVTRGAVERWAGGAN